MLVNTVLSNLQQLFVNTAVYCKLSWHGYDIGHGIGHGTERQALCVEH